MPADPQPPTPQPGAPQHAHRHVLALAGFCAVLALLCSVAFTVQGPSGGAAYYAYFALSLAPLVALGSLVAHALKGLEEKVARLERRLDELTGKGER